MNHVKTELEENKSWCGEILTVDFYFANAEFAAINGLNMARERFICEKCIEAIQKALHNARA